MPLALPRPLRPGDRVAIVSPSGPVTRDVWVGLAWLRARYALALTPGMLAREGYLAGSDARRASELARAIEDDRVAAIVATRGGYGAMRILDRLPWDALAKRPKWIIGFSDVTALHLAAANVGIASVHGPNAGGLGRASPAVRAAWLDAVERPSKPVTWSGLRVLRPGEAEGPVTGGNLALVAALAAAGRLEIPERAIVLLEDVGEAPYRVDRMLTSLRLGPALARASAVVFGSFERCGPAADGVTIEDVLARFAAESPVPVLSGAPFGHGDDNRAFVMGRRARVVGEVVGFG